MENILKIIFSQHKGKLTDKWSLYINEWDDIFSLYKDLPINLLEIGIQNGGSLEIFAKYFQKAQNIIGCDINEAVQTLKFDDPRISVIIGDINSNEVENNIAEMAPHLDIIIDDGSHQSPEIIQSFCRYFKMLDDDGIYLIEDLHASYWADYEGGLFKPYTAMAFFKRLVDLTNFEHWQSNRSREEYLAPFKHYYDLDFDEYDFCQIHSITFINSLCVVHKRPHEENSLGKRVVVGSHEEVSKNYHKFDGISIHDMPKGTIDDAHLDVFSLMDHTEGLKTDLDERKQTNLQLRDVVDKREQSIQALQAEIDAKAQSIQQIKVDIAEREESLQQMKVDITEREQSLQQLSAVLLERDESIQRLKDKITEQTRVIQEQKTDIDQQNQALHQLQKDVAASIQQIQNYDQTIQALNQQVMGLNHEILFYALSKSWGLTRPLRKFMDFIRGK